MKRLFASILFVVAVVESNAQVQAHVPPSLRAGSMDWCVVSGGEGPWKVEVLNAARAVVFSTEAWKWPEPVRGQGVWVASIAVGVEKKSGPGWIRIADTTTFEEYPIQFLEREVRVEDIPLDRAMTQLRVSPDPQKDLEAKEIYRTYSTFDAKAVWARGKISAPLEREYRRSAFFGDSRKYLYSDGTSASDYHSGTDFACPEGTTVVSAASGLVVLAKKRLVTGFTVVLEHLPGVFTVYFHLASIQVRPGDLVEAMTPIGRSGATGLVTGPHLHWELRCKAIPVDATEFLGVALLDTARLEAVLSTPAIEQKRG